MRMYRRATIVAGAVILAAIGRDRFSLSMQGGGLFARMLRDFVDDPEIGELVDRRRYMREHWQAARRSKRSLDEYGADDLGGYGLETIRSADQHLPLDRQLRGLVIPHLRALFANGKALHVVEIGHGNGDILAHLAAVYPLNRFIGIDFSAKEASRHKLPNVEWKAGYALDMLESGALSGDVLFASSTFCYAGPREMRAYAGAIAARGFRHVVISDMCAKEWSPEKYPNESRYLHKGATGHDYRHYFAAVGYKTAAFEMVNYTGHAKRNLVRMQLLRLDRS